MKFNYISSVLLSTLLYTVNGQNTRPTKTLPPLSELNRTTITTTVQTSSLPTNSLCPPEVYNGLEELCQERGGKLIPDECGFYPICLLPCSSSRSTGVKVLPSQDIIEDGYVNHGSYNGYDYCSCIYSDKPSLNYGPAKSTKNIELCKEKIEFYSGSTQETTTTTTTTTTTSAMDSTPITTCPTEALKEAENYCNEQGGKFINEDCNTHPVCLLRCGNNNNNNKSSTTINSGLKSITSTKTLPSSIIYDYYLIHQTFNGYIYCSCLTFENITSGDLTTSSWMGSICKKYIALALPNDLSATYTDPIPLTTTTTTTTTATSAVDSTPVTTTKIVPDGLSGYVKARCQQYMGKLYMSSNGRKSVCFLPCSSNPVTTVKTKTLPGSSPSPATANFIAINDANGLSSTYCSCEININSTNHRVSTDLAECEAYAEELGYVKEKVESTCIKKTITITEKDSETITVKRMVTVTVTKYDEPTPVF